MSIPQHYKYAGFWWRCVAGLIDSLIALLWVAAIPFFLGMFEQLHLGATGTPYDPQAQHLLNAFGDLAGAVIAWLYHTLFESSHWQATPGGRMCGLIVTDESGNRIGFGKANGRYWSQIVSMLILFFGYFMIGWTKRKQGLHDKMAGTLVLRRPSLMERVVLPDVSSEPSRTPV